jgi:8-oxo-dGTP diphosphatase
MKKVVKVVAAAIEKDGKFFIAQRGSGRYKDYREFPGGKIEDGESEEAALSREIKEELKAVIHLEKKVGIIVSDYGDFTLSMSVFLSKFVSSFTLLEHESVKWVTLKDALKLNLLPGDIEAVRLLMKFDL